MFQKICSLNCTHKVRSSNADVHNVCDGLACVAFPVAAANFLQDKDIIVTITPSRHDMCELQCNKSDGFPIREFHTHDRSPSSSPKRH